MSTLTAAPRAVSFGAVGAAVAAFGFAALYVMTGPLGVNPHVAYLFQALASVELSFLLSRNVTWRDRRDDARREWIAFHVSRCVSIPANQGLFSLLVVGGAGVLAANGVCVAATAVVNYAVAHHLVFRHA